MSVYALTAVRRLLRPAILLSMLLSAQAYAQDKTLDFLGEINDADHPAGYREYVENGCWQCHGFQGQGMAGPALAPGPLPYEAFAAYVRKPAGVMPAYSPNILSEDRMKRIHAYLQALPPAPDPDSISLIPK
jgi:ubiquinol-cytochrome c reductase cytochrome c subunit